MSSYDKFARNQRVVIRTNNSQSNQSKHLQNNYSLELQHPNKQNGKTVPPLEKPPVAPERRNVDQAGPGNLATISEVPSKGKLPDLHFSEEERKKKNKLATYWRTRGSHDFILEQQKNVDHGKIKREQEKLFLKARREQALKDRIVEKKIEEAEAKGDIYIPEEEEEKEQAEQLPSQVQTTPGKVLNQKLMKFDDVSKSKIAQPKDGQINKGPGGELNKRTQQKPKKVKPIVVIGPTGERLPHNIAFLSEKIDENRASEYYKERQVKPGSEYDKHYGMSYAKKQKNHNMFDPLFCLCNPVYHWSRTDLFGNLQQEAEDVVHMLRYKTSEDGEPLYIMGHYRIGTFQHHSLWFPINTGFYLWFNILENSKKKFLLPNKLTWLEFDLAECQGKQLHINCYLIDSTNNEALRKSRSEQMPDLKHDVIKDEGIQFKSRLFSDTDSVVYVDVTNAFEHPNSQATCLLWVTCWGKAWLGNAWAITRRPRIIFKDKPDKKSTKKKLNF